MHILFLDDSHLSKKKPTCASLQKEINELKKQIRDICNTKERHYKWHKYLAENICKMKDAITRHNRLLIELEHRLYGVEERARPAGELDERITSIGTMVGKNSTKYTNDVMQTHLNEEHAKPTIEEKLMGKLKKIEPEINSKLFLYQDLSIESNEENKEIYRKFYALLCDITSALNDVGAYLTKKIEGDPEFDFAEDP